VTHSVHLVAFCPSHIDRPPLPRRNYRHTPLSGVPQLTGDLKRLADTNAIGGDDEREAGELIAAACQAIKANMAATYGGRWDD
jgi:hypothetical protein